MQSLWRIMIKDNGDVCKDLLAQKERNKATGLYYSSVGRFPGAPGAMIYPIYGQGELPQAFCRRAAVKGCIYDSGNYEGVKLASGQELFSNKVIVAPSFIDTSPEDKPSVANVLDYSKDFSLGDSRHKLAKAICISNASIKPNSANCLVFFPPRSLNAEHVSSVRVLQLSSNVAVCPPGMFITYLSAPCDHNMQGKNLQSAIDVLFYVPVSGSSANSTSDDENKKFIFEAFFTVEWNSIYKELTSALMTPSFLLQCLMVTCTNNIVDVTKKLFQKMYPGDEFSATANSFNEVDSDFGPEVEEL
ncbi:hypothetical protein Leryth_023251 [Lithospermum erythrorhizon]|nr:hypothetical protein Leryth_023251 [Lithospermum erythrorhizon]